MVRVPQEPPPSAWRALSTLPLGLHTLEVQRGKTIKTARNVLYFVVEGVVRLVVEPQSVFWSAGVTSPIGREHLLNFLACLDPKIRRTRELNNIDQAMDVYDYITGVLNPLEGAPLPVVLEEGPRLKNGAPGPHRVRWLRAW